MYFTKKMKKDWLDALKSGDFTPCTGNLIRNEKHCCLGVLCEVVDEFSIHKASGNSVMFKGESENYGPMSDIIGGDNIDELWKENDRSVSHDSTPYESVITLIEELPTSD